MVKYNVNCNVYVSFHFVIETMGICIFDKFTETQKTISMPILISRIESAL